MEHKSETKIGSKRKWGIAIFVVLIILVFVYGILSRLGIYNEISAQWQGRQVEAYLAEKIENGEQKFPIPNQLKGWKEIVIICPYTPKEQLSHDLQNALVGLDIDSSDSFNWMIYRKGKLFRTAQISRKYDFCTSSKKRKQVVYPNQKIQVSKQNDKYQLSFSAYK